MSPGEFTFLVTLLDLQNVTLTSEPYKFTLQRPSLSDLAGSITPLGENRFKLQVNWSSEPVVPELSSIYFKLNLRPSTRLAPETTSQSLTVNTESEYRVRVYGENWLGKSADSEIVIIPPASGSSVPAASLLGMAGTVIMAIIGSASTLH